MPGLPCVGKDAVSQGTHLLLHHSRYPVHARTLVSSHHSLANLKVAAHASQSRPSVLTVPEEQWLPIEDAASPTEYAMIGQGRADSESLLSWHGVLISKSVGSLPVGRKHPDPSLHLLSMLSLRSVRSSLPTHSKRDGRAPHECV